MGQEHSGWTASVGHRCRRAIGPLAVVVVVAVLTTGWPAGDRRVDAASTVAALVAAEPESPAELEGSVPAAATDVDPGQGGTATETPLVRSAEEVPAGPNAPGLGTPGPGTTTKLDPTLAANGSLPPPPKELTESSSGAGGGELLDVKPVEGFDPWRSVEDATKRSADSATYANPDGTRTTDFAAAPINYRNPESDSWERIDAQLVGGLPGSTVPWFENRSGPVKLRLAKQLGEGTPLAAIEMPGGSRLSWDLDDAANAEAQVGQIVTGIVGPPGSEAATASYRGVRPGVDLELTAKSVGVKESLILRDRSSVRSFAFSLDLEGLIARLNREGEVEFVDDAGKVAVVFPRGFMEDANIDPQRGEGVISTGVTYRLEGEGRSLRLFIDLDAAWLDDPTRVYPVVVDPTANTNSYFGADLNDLYVSTADSANHSGEDQLKVGPIPGTAHFDAAYAQWPNVGFLYHQHVVGAVVSAYQFWTGGNCSSPRPATLHRVTQPWGGQGYGWSGPSYAPQLDVETVMYGNPCAGNWVAWEAGVTEMVDGWLHDQLPNYGVTIRAEGSGTDPFAWRKFWSANAGGWVAPTLAVTWNSFDARYSQAGSVFLPTKTTTGHELITVTNKGPDTWATNGPHYMACRIYRSSDSAYMGQCPYQAPSTATAYNQSASIDMTIPALAPDTYTIHWEMVHTATPSTWYQDQFVMPMIQTITVPAIPPVIDGSTVSAGDTLTPTLTVQAHDPDNHTGHLWYNFSVCTGSDGKSGSCTNSGWLGQDINNWTVPTGFLSWSTPYYWNVQVSDQSSSYVPSFAVAGRLTQVPAQPNASHAGTDPTGTSIGDVNPYNGNYVSATPDVTLAGAGPQPSVVRTYNSAEARPGSTLAFGTGWSSLYDMSLKTDTDGSGNVVVTFPDGRGVRFGKNPDGTFASPPSMFATLTGTEASGYTYTDKSGTAYQFGATGGPLQKIVDSSGRELRLTYTSGLLSQARSYPTAASTTATRRLNFTWAGNHITTITTANLTGHSNYVGSNQPYTWTYTYSGDRLTDVCNPKSFDAQTCATNKTHYDYASFGLPATDLLIAVTLPEGNQPVQLNYNSDKTVQWRKNGTGDQWSFGYQTTNGLKTTTVTDPPIGGETGTEIFGYDAQGRLTTHVDQNGAARRIAYNDLGYPALTTDENGHVTSTGYDQRGNVLRTTANRSSGTNFAATVRSGSSPSIWWRLGEVSGTDALNSAEASCPAGLCTIRAGTYVGGPALNGIGPLTGDTAGAPTFDGSTQYVTSAHDAWNDQTGDLTLAAWIRPDDTTPAADQTIVAKKTTDGTKSYQLRIKDGNKLVYSHNNTTGSEEHTVDYGFQPGRWYHVAAVRQGTTIKLYVDGAQVASEPLIGTAVSVNAPFTVGARLTASGVGEAFQGAISDTLFYNSAQSTATIAAWYAAGLNTAYRDLLPLGNPPPTGWWRFGEASGTSASDSSGHGLTATYQGSQIQLGQPGAIAGDPDHAVTLNANGGSSYVRLPNGFSEVTAGLTMEAWVYPTAVGSYQRIFDLGNGEASDNIFFSRLAGTDKVYLGVFAGPNGNDYSGSIVTSPAGTIPLNEWSLLTATISPTGLATIYRNGTPVATGAVLVPRAVTRTQNYLGHSPWVGDVDFAGRIDDAAIYPAALSPADIAAHWAAATHQTANTATTVTAYRDVYRTPFSTAPLADAPAGYWRLGEPAGTTAADASGNNHPGSIHTSVNRVPTGAIVNDSDGSMLTTGAGPSAGPVSGTGITTPTQGFTLETWANIPDTARHGAFVTTGPNSTHAVGLGVGNTTLENDGNKLVAIYENQCWLDSGISLGTGWHHVALRVRASDGAAEFFLDGLKVATKTTCTPGATRTDAWAVGGYSTARQTTGIGYDEAAIYTTALTDTRLREHYLVGMWRNLDARNDHLTASRDARSAGPTDTAFQTTYTYDPAGRMLSATGPTTAACPSGCAASVAYSNGTEAGYSGGTIPVGLPKTTTDPRGKQTQYAYDSKGDLRTVTDPVGLQVTHTYDILGRRTQTATSPGGTTTFTYDPLNRVLTVTEPSVTNQVSSAPHRAKATNTYDNNENLIQTQLSDIGGSATPDTTRQTTYTYDDNDLQITVTDAQNHTTSTMYDPFGHPISTTDATGTVTQYAYTPTGWLWKTTIKNFIDDPLAQPPSSPRDVIIDQRSYDPAGRLAREQDALGRVTAFTYTDDNLLATTTRLGYHHRDNSTQDVVLASRAYDAAGNLASLDTGDGASHVQNSYDAANRLTASVLDPAGLDRTLSLVYDPAGNVLNRSIADANRTDTTTLTYDNANRELTRNFGGITTSVQRDARGLVTAGTDGRNNTTNYTYDALGRPYQAQEPQISWEENGAAPQQAQPTTTLGYDTFGAITHQRDRRSLVTRATYDTLGQTTERIWPQYSPPGGTALIPNETYTYDALGRLLTSTDRRNHTTTYDYDKRSRLLRTTGTAITGLGAPITRAVYDDADQLVTILDPTGTQTNYGYDDLGRARAATLIERQPGTQNLTTTYDYDFLDNPTYRQTPEGNITTAAYNPADEPTSTTIDPGTAPHLNRTTNYTHDVSGRLTETVDPLGRKITTGWDTAGRRASVVTYNAAGTPTNIWSWGHDNNDNVTSYSPPRGFFVFAQTFNYDAANRLTSMVTPIDATPANDITTSFGYDLAANRTRVTDGRANATITTYNTLGLIENVVEPATTAHPNTADRTFTTKYDAGGLPIEDDEPGGVVRTRTFNQADWLTNESGSGGGATAASRTLGYDLDGRVTSLSHPNGTIGFAYNDRDAIIATTGPAGATSFAYDGDGHMTNRADAAGSATFTYDAADQLKTATDPLTGTTRTYTYDPAGRLDTLSYGTGKALRDLTYDDLDRVTLDTLTSGTGTTLQTVAYGYDPDNNTTSKTLGPTGVAGAGTQTYGYDRLDRLTQWTDPTSITTNYTYDASHNRTGYTNPTTTATISFDQRNRQGAKTVTVNGTPTTGTSTYTARGTLTSRQFGTTTTNLAFDALDRATTIGTTTYTYDALDRLATDGTATFTYAGDQPEPTTDGTFTLGRGPTGELAALKKNTTSLATLTDQHGDLIADFNPSTNTLTDSRAYNPTGQIVATNGTTNPTIGYQAQWTSPTTNQVHMGIRWYAPDDTSFLSRDPTDLAPTTIDGINRYAYGAANPISRADRSGAEAVPVPWQAGAGAGAGAAAGACAASVGCAVAVGVVLVAIGVGAILWGRGGTRTIDLNYTTISARPLATAQRVHNRFSNTGSRGFSLEWCTGACARSWGQTHGSGSAGAQSRGGGHGGGGSAARSFAPPPPFAVPLPPLPVVAPLNPLIAFPTQTHPNPATWITDPTLEPSVARGAGSPAANGAGDPSPALAETLGASANSDPLSRAITEWMPQQVVGAPTDPALPRADASRGLVGTQVPTIGPATLGAALGQYLAAQGGLYGELSTEQGVERHHMPAKSAYEHVSTMKPRCGPAIKMDKADHRKTGSWGRRTSSQEYQDVQRELIDEGRFEDAFLMDVDDIRAEFGGKYDQAILEAIDALDRMFGGGPCGPGGPNLAG